jgi:hypothetical protein
LLLVLQFGVQVVQPEGVVLVTANNFLTDHWQLNSLFSRCRDHFVFELV